MTADTPWKTSSRCTTQPFGRGDAQLNIQASADIGAYSADLSVSFCVEQPRVQAMMTVERLQAQLPRPGRTSVFLFVSYWYQDQAY